MPKAKQKIDINLWVTTHLSRISFVQKTFFVNHLKIMLKAGLSLVDALDILKKEIPDKNFKIIIDRLKHSIEGGKTLSESLSAEKNFLKSAYIKMVEAGEISGKLEDALEQIVSQMKKSHALSASIKGALIYPCVVLTAMFGLGIFVAVFVLPKLITIFNDFNASLPITTRILIFLVNTLSNPIYLAGFSAATIISIGSFIYFLKTNKKFKHFIHTVNLKLPIVAPIIKKINLAQFSLSLSSLLKSTIPIVDAVDITSETCTNNLYQDALHKAAAELKTGTPLSEILVRNEKLFPPMITQMIMVGERTGEVDHLLNEVAAFYSEEVDSTMKNMSAIIEPVIIILIGLAVGGLAVSIIMPMYTLMQNF